MPDLVFVQSPLRPKTAQEFEEQGYRRAHEGVHIMRDKAIFEEKRYHVDSGAACRALSFASMENTLPDHLDLELICGLGDRQELLDAANPNAPKKEKKKKKEGGGKKKKK